MLRIMNQPQTTPPDQSEPDADDIQPTSKGKYDIDKVDPTIAGYLGPEDGPFQCARCIHFDGQGSCNVVAGPIDPEGCCNLFQRGDEDVQNEDSEAVPAGGPTGPEGGQEQGY